MTKNRKEGYMLISCNLELNLHYEVLCAKSLLITSGNHWKDTAKESVAENLLFFYDTFSYASGTVLIKTHM